MNLIRPIASQVWCLLSENDKSGYFVNSLGALSFFLVCVARFHRGNLPRLCCVFQIYGRFLRLGSSLALREHWQEDVSDSGSGHLLGSDSL
jgi:hypothetical protein